MAVAQVSYVHACEWTSDAVSLYFDCKYSIGTLVINIIYVPSGMYKIPINRYAVSPVIPFDPSGCIQGGHNLLAV